MAFVLHLIHSAEIDFEGSKKNFKVVGEDGEGAPNKFEDEELQALLDEQTSQAKEKLTRIRNVTQPAIFKCPHEKSGSLEN